MSSPTFTPQFDPALIYPPLATARAAFPARDWAGIRTVPDTLDWAGHRAVVRELSDEDWAEDVLRGVVARDPSDLTAAAALGEAVIAAGWRIRTTSRAKNVTRAQFDALHSHLRRAEQILIDVTARGPGHASAWISRLTTARGLELGQNEARRRYDRCVKAVPNFVPALRSLAQQLCPKWIGSWAALHAFARECVATAPEGDHSAIVVMDAHMEHWVELDSAERAVYWQSPEVRQDVRAAAERSVLNPAFAMTWGWAAVVSGFAAVLSRIGDLEAAARCFQKLGTVATHDGWSHLRDPEVAFVQDRAKALAALGQS